MPKQEINGSERINFKSGVQDILYRQAGGRCSVPRCTNPTMGPFYHKDGAVNMGAACHIYSAATGGPRGRGGQDVAFIESEGNGIWCCPYHGTLIDKANGIDYPSSSLFAWKMLAEARVRKQMNDAPSPLGWVESIEFIQFPALATRPRIQLSRCTLLYGANESGKSALLEAAASVSNSRHGERLANNQKKNSSGEWEAVVYQARVVYSTVDSLSKEINLEFSKKMLIRCEGSTPCLLPPGDLQVIFCDSKSGGRLDREDDVDFLKRALSLDRSAVFALTNLGGGTLMPGAIQFREASRTEDSGETMIPWMKSDGDPYFELKFKKYPRDSFVSFSSLSATEQSRLILDLFISKAREVAKQRLTLLLIEDMANYFDEGNFAALLESLSREAFQVIISLPYAREKTLIKRDAECVVLHDLDYLRSWGLATLPAPLGRA